MKCRVRGVILLLLFVATTANAMLPVIDIEAITKAAQQIQILTWQLSQLKNQLDTAKDQYNNMIKNTENLKNFNWDQAKNTINKILDIQNQMNYYTQQSGSVQQYLNQFQDLKYYSSQPCFNGNACTQAQLTALNDKRRLASASQKHANDALFEAIQNQQKNLESDAQHLETLQMRAQTADGQVKAIQYANQLASQQVNQLLQLRTVMLAGQNALAVERQQELDREAQREAAHRQARSGDIGQSSPDTGWSFNP